jgi:hypothetical protein
MLTGAVEVCEDLGLRIGANKAALSPGQAFIVAEQLIRRATRQMVIEEVAAAGADILEAVDGSADQPSRQ